MGAGWETGPTEQSREGRTGSARSTGVAGRAVLDDAALAALAVEQGCDGQAFGELHRRFHGQVRAYVRRRTPASMVDDAVQETFLRLWRHLDRYDSERGAFGGYVFTIARSVCCDVRRREERVRRSAAQVEDREDMVASARPEQADLRSVVAEALAVLSAPHRDAVELAYWRGYSQSEIAGVLDVPLGTVKTRTLWALRHLREALTPALAA